MTGPEGNSEFCFLRISREKRQLYTKQNILLHFLYVSFFFVILLVFIQYICIYLETCVVYTFIQSLTKL